ncbi:hypothetical protein CANCADRAFT_80972 [Tortispora caseinolytica NRRL Y-17796]|uniref:Uncharacterized protein n=1 Tax=Tortispora caseinolytica NRRL Y-17796 TaxID=767744 RepID=A0A1E4TJR5_9ASCO|nr:hypothetical protein CANCADRAFT_80972 [Tortispora caseinolytica NRRL Y-17796]
MLRTDTCLPVLEPSFAGTVSNSSDSLSLEASTYDAEEDMRIPRSLQRRSSAARSRSPPGRYRSFSNRHNSLPVTTLYSSKTPSNYTHTPEFVIRSPSPPSPLSPGAPDLEAFSFANEIISDANSRDNSSEGALETVVDSKEDSWHLIPEHATCCVDPLDPLHPHNPSPAPKASVQQAPTSDHNAADLDLKASNGTRNTQAFAAFKSRKHKAEFTLASDESFELKQTKKNTKVPVWLHDDVLTPISSSFASLTSSQENLREQLEAQKILNRYPEGPRRRSSGFSLPNRGKILSSVEFSRYFPPIPYVEKSLYVLNAAGSNGLALYASSLSPEKVLYHADIAHYNDLALDIYRGGGPSCGRLICTVKLKPERPGAIRTDEKLGPPILEDVYLKNMLVVFQNCLRVEIVASTDGRKYRFEYHNCKFYWKFTKPNKVSPASSTKFISGSRNKLHLEFGRLRRESLKAIEPKIPHSPEGSLTERRSTFPKALSKFAMHPPRRASTSPQSRELLRESLKGPKAIPDFSRSPESSRRCSVENLENIQQRRSSFWTKLRRSLSTDSNTIASDAAAASAAHANRSDSVSPILEPTYSGQIPLYNDMSDESSEFSNLLSSKSPETRMSITNAYNELYDCELYEEGGSKPVARINNVPSYSLSPVFLQADMEFLKCKRWADIDFAELVVASAFGVLIKHEQRNIVRHIKTFGNGN